MFASREEVLNGDPQYLREEHEVLVVHKTQSCFDLRHPAAADVETGELKFCGEHGLRPAEDVASTADLGTNGGIAFAGSQFVFAGYSGAPFSNRAFNLRLRAACRAIGVGEITAHGLRHSAATILLNHVRKDLREIQELLRHKNIRTTVRYAHVGYEQTRQTAEALSQALE